eukprot:CAMPEP_0205829054 /NCGR_PEP_ID=MMETSP0206-20130828/36899_1 /ASSEMBLY_ACC=CAM_ASM_000279 /TAXON_ID=36767 /ORGANISM="Euplotes focardii, Strain TN1" /LENGTH=186 /DNA_ID=CAMNT_0053131431 /DNA_START=32 /DNA_END=588 /DNA_ORIENTATION=+
MIIAPVLRRQVGRLTSSQCFRRLCTGARQPSRDATFPDVRLETRLFINNKFVDSVTGSTFETFNPGTGEVLARVAEAQEADVNLAVAAAKEAFDQGPWRDMAPRERGACLYRLAALLEQHTEELAQLEALNNGKTLNQAAMVDAPACPAILRYYAGWADKINGKSIPIGPDFNCTTVHEPVGVCAL